MFAVTGMMGSPVFFAALAVGGHCQTPMLEAANAHSALGCGVGWSGISVPYALGVRGRRRGN